MQKIFNIFIMRSKYLYRDTHIKLKLFLLYAMYYTALNYNIIYKGIKA